MQDTDFHGAAQIYADNQFDDPLDIIVPDPVVIELQAFKSEVDSIVDELMAHHWIKGKIDDGWNITESVVYRALKAHLTSVFDDYINTYQADDHMHGTLGSRLQHEILEMADKAATKSAA